MSSYQCPYCHKEYDFLDDLKNNTAWVGDWRCKSCLDCKKDFMLYGNPVFGLLNYGFYVDVKKTKEGE